jgi:hypothetical protein
MELARDPAPSQDMDQEDTTQLYIICCIDVRWRLRVRYPMPSRVRIGPRVETSMNFRSTLLSVVIGIVLACGPTRTQQPPTPNPTSTPATYVLTDRALPTPRPGDRSSFISIPPAVVLSVGGTLTTSIGRVPVDLTLLSLRDTTRNASADRRTFETTFLIRNKSNDSLTFLPENHIQGLNSGGVRGRIDATYPTGNPVTVPEESETTLVLSWNTFAYSGAGRSLAPLAVWIVVNTPIQASSVTLTPGAGVFKIELPQIPG